MEFALQLIPGVNVFTAVELMKKAAASKRLKLWEGSSPLSSRPIKEYTLDEHLLNALAKSGIRQNSRPDDVLTLTDYNDQEPRPGFVPSNYWNFRRSQDLSIGISVTLHINVEKRGVVFLPQTSATILSPTDHLPNFRMFKALVLNDPKAPAIAKKLALSDGEIVVTWTDLELSGIRTVRDLFFKEFAERRQEVAELARLLSIFDLNPSNRKELYVTESIQPQLFRTWRRQLQAYRDRLVA